MLDTDAKSYTPEQMAFATRITNRIERFPDEQRPTMRALLSAFLTGAEAMCSDSLLSEHPEKTSEQQGVSK